jgi:hypothetical protein
VVGLTIGEEPCLRLRNLQCHRWLAYLPIFQRERDKHTHTHTHTHIGGTLGDGGREREREERGERGRVKEREDRERWKDDRGIYLHYEMDTKVSR